MVRCSELAECREQFGILRARADGDAQTVVAQRHTVAVADNDAAVHQIVVDALGVRHAGQKEVRVGAEHLLAQRQILERLHQPLALVQQYLHPLVHLERVLQHLHRLLLRQQIDVVGILHLIIYIDNLPGGKGHAQTDGCRGPRLRHGLQDDEVLVADQLGAQRLLLREVDVRLVDDDDALERLDDLHYLVAAERIASRVVGRADPHYLRALVARCQQLVGMHLEVVVQQDATVLHVVDVGTHLIHAVRRLDGHHVVTPRLAEDAVSQVDGLVAAVAQEYHVLGHALHLLQQLLQLALQRVGVAVVGGVVRILVGIEEDVSLLARIFITGTAVRSQAPDVLADQLF